MTEGEIEARLKRLGDLSSIVDKDIDDLDIELFKIDVSLAYIFD